MKFEGNNGEKLYKVIVPDSFIVETPQIVELKRLFQESAENVFPLSDGVSVTDTTNSRSTASLKWPHF